MKADQTQSSTSEKLPETGEEAHYAIFGVAALSILAGLGMVAKRKEQ
ncbi:LPXTG cell wall anchor domain-containing protein [Aerococcaceae bacterium NML191292]|nr:LPXTG cell wall anchor domain-containing protein [Aerococcaceae bacterium NML210727]MCW6659811.1 LPXTG cell wall anchor domain-containing protein [Aerococcaceae bacterium NML191292]MCW6661848.1 LPXTG cell wall anchor domain-containing protein [Aerococcaceae bacterium NML201209]MCW6663655.1 LPXTG cell wall anchor domain-containing protein [Aerococcaceae bacterium NML190073]MCW6665063.1 LPXTG cell wall anchor domain-containing protein [Aerococcaceae bacterium NML191219]MCW6666423.1 LPXTG cell